MQDRSKWTIAANDPRNDGSLMTRFSAEQNFEQSARAGLQIISTQIRNFYICTSSV